MGKSTRFFRQTKKSMSGTNSARNYGPIMRSEGWHVRIWNYIKVRGKSNAES